MGNKEKKFAEILVDNENNVYFPTLVNKNFFRDSRYHNIINEVYQGLGGILDEYLIGFGNFDIVTEDYFIEVDEEQHFHRYRAMTLQASIYQNNTYFPIDDYQRFCRELEKNARTDGGFWTNKSCERQFGKSSPERDFNGNGPARWKQRAFYDFLKDVYSLITGKPVYRFSIYEMVAGRKINSILKRGKNEEELFDFISQRISTRNHK